MSQHLMLSQQKVEKGAGIIADLKSLFKAVVLVANVLPVITGLWLALYFTQSSFTDHLDTTLLTIIGSTMVMAGALLLNNWYDVDIDSVMERTKNRPTVTGTISLKVVLIMGVSFSIIGFILLLFTTLEAAVYSLIGWFTYVVLYTMWSKRRFTFNTIIGSVSGAVTPLIGWSAIDSSLNTVPIVLFFILFIWQMPHTFAIAMKKCHEYKAAGVAVLPVVRGFAVTKRQMFVYISCLLPLPFFLEPLGTPFMVMAALLNIGWLGLSVSGFFIKDSLKWAHMNFIYSVNYLVVLFTFMILAIY
nr:heme o synthase [Neobacillus sp. Marseille-Q6967]